MTEFYIQKGMTQGREEGRGEGENKGKILGCIRTMRSLNRTQSEILEKTERVVFADSRTGHAVYG